MDQCSVPKDKCGHVLIVEAMMCKLILTGLPNVIIVIDGTNTHKVGYKKMNRGAIYDSPSLYAFLYLQELHLL